MKPLTLGDPAPRFSLPDQNQTSMDLNTKAGQPILLLFYPNDNIPSCQGIAAAFRELHAKIRQLQVRIYSISLDAPESRKTFAQTNQIPFPLLCDVHQVVSRQYRVYLTTEDPKYGQIITYHRTAFLLDPNLRIRAVYSLENLAATTPLILEDIQKFFPVLPSQKISTLRAPVLFIPHVLEPDFCQDLIQVWKTQGNKESGSMHQHGDKTIKVIDYTHKIRRDHLIRNQELKKQIDQIMKRRVFPEIEKVHQFQVTHREHYKIVAYDAQSGGYFRRHRDNTTRGTAHRKFAMTINLNLGEYEGGCLRFPEYDSDLYQPQTGSALIFSCSLMHEATDVTLGCRFALLSFFYGEEEAKARKEYEEKIDNNYNEVIRRS